MKRNHAVLLGALLVLGVLALAGGRATGTKTARATSLQLTPIQQRLLSGFASFEFQHAPGATEQSTARAQGSHFTATTRGCAGNYGNNIKVNQNCLNISDLDLQGRGQAENETAIAQDPKAPTRLIGASNDYLRGDGTCGSHWTRGNGAWTDSTMPNGFVRGAAFGGVSREYFEASGDPSVAWDSKGNAYYNCMMFDRGVPTTNNPDLSSAIYMFRSTANSGASWNFPGRPVVEDYDTTGATLIDKPYMAIDNRAGSPFQDRIYVSWTFFNSDGTAYLYEAYSSDYGESFRSPVLVSTDNPTLCKNTYGLPTLNGNCNENQFANPFVGPDGALYVGFDNYNNTVTGSDNRNQVLLVKSTDGGASFSAPVKVADFYDLPDCLTYQGADAFRACVPEKGSQTDSIFRATNYPSGGVDPTNANHVAVTVGSYINKDSKESNGCVPAGLSGTTGLNLYTGVKTAGACNNKILVSVSTDGGSTFTGTTIDPRDLTVVNQQANQTTTDQWWQWSAFNTNGKLVVAYYDRQYGDDETSGSMDISISASTSLTNFATKRVTTSSMPLPTQFPDANGNSLFFGDYTGLSVSGTANPIWMDTRNPDLALCPGTGTPGVPPALCTFLEPNGRQANDQDIYTAQLGLP